MLNQQDQGCVCCGALVSRCTMQPAQPRHHDGCGGVLFWVLVGAVRGVAVRVAVRGAVRVLWGLLWGVAVRGAVTLSSAYLMLTRQTGP